MDRRNTQTRRNTQEPWPVASPMTVLLQAPLLQDVIVFVHEEESP
jgi:hypothetical protein